jgi:hypothetical protein
VARLARYAAAATPDKVLVSSRNGLTPAVMQIADAARACVYEDQGVAAGAFNGLSGRLLTSSALLPLRASH